ncbi:MAG: hypothetical protein IAE77_16120 [Prosthecobacter sp.]|jgi:hypothetical protein|uniref:hypothetical protein n=1 Tax=Prosthecobacter sp. TaxID=1965333 RepID=UPI001A025DB9|nr:hypothetical protein [Prosthecobacter sp.]MBE2284988.1 hypothetical protein [Prosthecobacter sp.]
MPSSFKQPLCILALISTLHAVEPPSCEWVFSGGGGGHDKTRAVTTDRAGNVFLASECVGDAMFGDQQHKTAGEMDMCLTKLDAAGKPLWVSGFGGSKTDRAYGVITDAAGNAYVTGHFESTDAMANGEKVPNAGSYDAFTAKFAPDGKLLWVRVKGGEGSDYGHGIAIDSKGHVVITGAIGGQFFCTKYDAEGREIWHRTPSGKVSGSGHGIAIDGKDHIYLGGSASGAGTFGKVAIESKTSAALVLKLTPEGEGEWVNLIPGTTTAIYHEIACDSQGRVWGAGMFKGSVSVAGQTFQAGTEKDYEGLIVHLDAAGQVQWAKHMHGPGTDYCLGVTTDDHGTAFVCGDFNQDTVLAGHALATRGSGDIFVAAFDVKGGLLWVQQAGGKLNDSAYPITFRAPDELIIAGALSTPATFGTHEVTKSGSSDLYAAKWKLKPLK